MPATGSSPTISFLEPADEEELAIASGEYTDAIDIWTGPASAFCPLSLAHMSMGAGLDWAHRDPWDRLILAQSLIEDCKLVTVVCRQPG